MNLARAWAELDVARHKAELYRMWHAGYHAGLHHHTVLENAGHFPRSPTVHRVRHELLAGLERGATVTAVVKANATLFLPFEAALLELGEESGRLEECLRLLGDYFAAEHRMITWLKKKLTYPMFNALAAAVLGPLPLVFTGHTGAYLVSAGGALALCAAAGGGLLLAAVTGSMLFVTEATAYVRNPAFYAKQTLILLGLVNIAIFHRALLPQAAAWPEDAPPPMRARVSGALSAATWIFALICGRFIAYV